MFRISGQDSIPARRDIGTGMPEEWSMKTLAEKLGGFLRECSGPTATEYAVLPALIIIAAMASISPYGCKLNLMYLNIQGELPANS